MRGDRRRDAALVLCGFAMAFTASNVIYVEPLAEWERTGSQVYWAYLVLASAGPWLAAFLLATGRPRRAAWVALALSVPAVFQSVGALAFTFAWGPPAPLGLLRNALYALVLLAWPFALAALCWRLPGTPGLTQPRSDVRTLRVLAAVLGGVVAFFYYQAPNSDPFSAEFGDAFVATWSLAAVLACLAAGVGLLAAQTRWGAWVAFGGAAALVLAAFPQGANALTFVVRALPLAALGVLGLPVAAPERPDDAGRHGHESPPIPPETTRS